MSYRLYTDIIVAAKIVDSYKRTCCFFKDELGDVYISIESCLIMQGFCKCMGIENVFTNSGSGNDPNRDWQEKDYRNFLNRFPQYFTKVDGIYYKVKIENLIGNSGSPKKSNFENDIINALRTKLLEHSYTDRILYALGLEIK